MKIPRLEAMRRTQREYHRSHPWQLSEGGLFIPHSYGDMAPDSLSSWDDVGFILNRRRVIVWWQHPRHVYAEALWDEVWREVGGGPTDSWLSEGWVRNYKRGGRTRKKPVTIMRYGPSPAKQTYEALLTAKFQRLSCEGIDHNIIVSWKAKRLWWAMGVNIGRRWKSETRRTWLKSQA